MLDVAEAGSRLFEFAAPFDVDVVGSIDKDDGQLVIVEKWLERTQPNLVVGKVGREQVLFALVELDPLLGRDLLNEFGDLALQRGSWLPRRCCRIDARH